jgi:L-amino acid N-acyltransferase YncA
MTIRHARPSDIERVVAIYNQTVPQRMATADLEPVTVAHRRAWFHERDPKRRPLWVAQDDDGRVLAWLSVNDFYGRAAYAATAEVGVYVAEEARGQGLGSQLLKHAIECAPTLGLTTLLAFIFAHNRPSIALFERHDFTLWGQLPGVARLDENEVDLTILGRRV